jgi:hypothetical protein
MLQSLSSDKFPAKTDSDLLSKVRLRMTSNIGVRTLERLRLAQTLVIRGIGRCDSLWEA